MFPRFRAANGASINEWIIAIKDNPKKFRKDVLYVCNTSFANLDTQWATTKTLTSLGCIFECHVCDKKFSSKQSLALHKYKAHGLKSIERRYINTTHCPVCLLEMWTRERVINHVKKSNVCSVNLLLRPPILSIEQADEMDVLELGEFKALKAKGLRRHAALKPCMQASGPLQRPVIIDPETYSGHHPLGKGHCKHL